MVFTLMGPSSSANERAKWLLKRIPGDAFDGGGFTMPKAYWEQWLKWSNDAGVFGAGGKGAAVADTPTGPAFGK